jgi:hypothetical protein
LASARDARAGAPEAALAPTGTGETGRLAAGLHNCNDPCQVHRPAARRIRTMASQQPRWEQCRQDGCAGSRLATTTFCLAHTAEHAVDAFDADRASQQGELFGVNPARLISMRDAGASLVFM